jgi:hypothetical protein
VELIADLLIAVAEFFEAEMASARQCLMRLMIAGAIVLIGMGVVLGAVVLVAWGLYALLLPAAGLVGAAFLAAAILLIVGLFIIFVCAKRYAR